LCQKHSEEPAPNESGASFINPAVMTKPMSHTRDDTAWLQNGSQRAAVARVLRKPMTAVEICEAARQWAPRLQLRDVWFLLRQMQDKGLALPLTGRCNYGRLHALTDAGRRAVQTAFGVSIASPSKSVDWKLYSWVVRSRNRKRVLLGMARVEAHSSDGLTASQIRNQIHAQYPVGLNHVLQAVRELAGKKLITCVGTARGRVGKLYRLGKSGNEIVRELTS